MIFHTSLVENCKQQLWSTILILHGFWPSQSLAKYRLQLLNNFWTDSADRKKKGFFNVSCYSKCLKGRAGECDEKHDTTCLYLSVLHYMKINYHLTHANSKVMISWLLAATMIQNAYFLIFLDVIYAKTL